MFSKISPVTKNNLFIKILPVGWCELNDPKNETTSKKVSIWICVWEMLNCWFLDIKFHRHESIKWFYDIFIMKIFWWRKIYNLNTNSITQV